MADTERDRTRAPNWLARPKDSASTPSPRTNFSLFQAPSETGWVLTFALVIALCVIAMAVTAAALRLWRPTTSIAAPGSAVVAPPNPGLAEIRSQLAVTESIEKQAREKEQALADQRREAAITAREALEDAARKTAALETRREREWQATYRKPAFCDESLPNIDSVGCANDYIRARRAFDEKFSAGTRR